jgi:hypothetical protein
VVCDHRRGANALHWRRGAQSKSALRALDSDIFLAGLAASSRGAILRAEAAAEASRRAMRGFRAAPDDRCGQGVPILEEEPAALTASLGRFTRLDVISVENADGRGTVLASSAGPTELLNAMRESGRWRLALPAARDRSPVMLDAIERARASIRLDRALAPDKQR